jgi:hypothetical protein
VSVMIPPSWTMLPLRVKRTGSKRFLRTSTNGNENTLIESNCRISADPSPQGSKREMACLQQLTVEHSLLAARFRFVYAIWQRRGSDSDSAAAAPCSVLRLNFEHRSTTTP